MNHRLVGEEGQPNGMLLLEAFMCMICTKTVTNDRWETLKEVTEALMAAPVPETTSP